MSWHVMKNKIILFFNSYFNKLKSLDDIPPSFHIKNINNQLQLTL